MSTLLVEVCKVDSIEAHPNADNLELCICKGWQTAVRKGDLKPNDVVVYFPPDTVLPIDISDKLNVTKYLSHNRRVKSIKLRGQYSHGIVIKNETGLSIGENAADYFKVTKYEPPVNIGLEDQERDHPLFIRYTDIENLRNFPDIIKQGEEVYIALKVHGTNIRIGLIENELMIGSHNYRRKQPTVVTNNRYWQVLDLYPQVKKLLDSFSSKQVIIYGEIFGKKIQKGFDYGRDFTDFVAFDLLIDGSYIDYQEFIYLCNKFSIPNAPILYKGPFNINIIKDLVEGESIIGGKHINEGCVIRSVKERYNPKIGRTILKYVTDAYLAGDYFESEIKEL